MSTKTSPGLTKLPNVLTFNLFVIPFTGDLIDVRSTLSFKAGIRDSISAISDTIFANSD